MPLYEYLCPQCGRFELIKKFSDEPVVVCPTCGKDIQKLISSPAIQFKGSGWYITDYARKGSGGGAEGDKGKGTDKGSSSDTASSSDTGKSDTTKSDSTSKAESSTKSDSTPTSSTSK